MCFLHLLANYWGDHLRKIYDFHPFRSFIDFMKLLASETSRYVFVKTKYVWLQPAPFQAIPSVITIKEVWIESNIYKHDHGKKNSNKEHCNLESICITTHLHPHPRLHTQIQLGDYIYIYTTIDLFSCGRPSCTAKNLHQLLSNIRLVLLLASLAGACHPSIHNTLTL